MPLIDIPRQYADGEVLTEAHLDAIFDDITTFLNTTKLDGDNYQNEAFTSTELSAVSATNTHFATDAVTTSKIADAAITTAKRASVTTSSDGSNPGVGGITYEATDWTPTQGTTTEQENSGWEITLSTSGRPVFVGLVSKGTNTSYIEVESTENGSDAKAYVRLRFYRDTTRLTEYYYGHRHPPWDYLEGHQGPLRIPVSLYTIDTPSAGTYVYTLKVKMDAADYKSDINNMTLIAYEL